MYVEQDKRYKHDVATHFSVFFFTLFSY